MPGPQGLQGSPGADGAPGAAGPAGSTPFSTVAAIGNLPAASTNLGKSYYVTGVNAVYVSDGSVWRILYGDTLTRDVSNLLDAGWKLATSNGYLRIRRQGATVHIAGRLQRVTAGAAYTAAAVILTLPTGFTPLGGQICHGVAWKYSTAMGLVNTVASATRLDVNFPGASGNYAVDDAVFFSATWWTDTVWPTTLPGS